MKNTDQRVLAAAVDALASGRGGWLLTIAATFGASPRPLGSLAFLDNDGQFTGSLSGGCIEDDLLEKLADGRLAAEHCTLQEYGVTPEENERFGLPCGGRMKVLIEPVAAASHLARMKELLLALNARECRRRCVDLNSGEWLLSAPDRVCPLTLTEEMLQQDFGPRFQLLLVGANELARCISEIATAMDYRVVVCDPRDDRREQWVTEGVELTGLMPDEAVTAFARDAHSIVITLTHDPRIDDMALMQALREECFYVGALGSERTSSKRRERLAMLDLSETQIQQLHAPVGLAIGSKSAMEIAVAVMAELVQLRSGAGG
ncbi:XdhC family protein [Spongiibacter sp.]|uniref:XdhC family protein n=1 Tax=Spongiibacter sp. TaxID=2024860 RepID=UPI000C5CF096|nr:XdhC family protein [Spongiibacter sp.]MBU70706.1 hypothetical protein [Spongiibacter sp.]